MKRNIAIYSFFCTSLLISFSNFRCHKEKVDSFCTVQRSDYLTVSNKAGTVVYSSRYQRYAISINGDAPNTIDTQITGFVCDLPSEFKSTGLKVLVTGALKIFNSDEGMTPEMGGQKVCFLEISQIIKQ